MKTQLRRLLAGLALVLAVSLAAPGSAEKAAESPWKPVVPANAYKEIVGRAAKVIEANIGKDEDSTRKARVMALVVAAATLSTKEGGSPEHLEAVRAGALKLARLLKEKGPPDEAKKLAAALPTLPADPAAKAEAGELHKYAEDINDLMNLYRTMPKGGVGLPPQLQLNARLKGTQNGVEELIRHLAKKTLSTEQVDKADDELALLGYKMVVGGELTYLYAPAKADGKKSPAEWRHLSLAMRDAGEKLAEAARKKDADAIFKAANSLDASCNQCHSVFRN